MTNATHSLDTSTGLRSAFEALRAHLSEKHRRDHAYRQTFRELDRMSDRDLADIGIPRVMIGDIAAEAAARV